MINNGAVSLIDGHIDEPLTDIEKKIYDCLFVKNYTVEKTAELCNYSERQIYRIKKRLKEYVG